MLTWMCIVTSPRPQRGPDEECSDCDCYHTEESCAVLQCCRSQGAQSGGSGARCLISNYALGWKYTNKSVAKVVAPFQFIWTVKYGRQHCFNFDSQTICTLNFVWHAPSAGLLLFKRPSEVSYCMLSNSLCAWTASALITSLNGQQECPLYGEEFIHFVSMLSTIQHACLQESVSSVCHYKKFLNKFNCHLS